MRYSSISLVLTIFFAGLLLQLSTAADCQVLSQFERAGMCDLLIDKAGLYHAVFQESQDIGKPVFIYYSVSNNKGATWSKPLVISNDNSGNGAGYPRIIQDGKGVIYAIWKRYGKSKSEYPIDGNLLDGPGGYAPGTVFYKVLNGATWSNAVQLNEDEEAQSSWFATVGPQGTVYVLWMQASPESIKNHWNTWYYFDYLRSTSLNGTGHSAFTGLNKPHAPEYAGGPPPKKGAINLHGYIDNAGLPHLIYEDIDDNAQEIKYYDGKAQRVVYTYPKYKEGNTFQNPPRLLVDEKGNDHLLFVPSAVTLESEQIWDVNLTSNQKTVLTEIQKAGVNINGFQATQGPGGTMAATIEAGSSIDNSQGFGFYYSKGTWKTIGLTTNTAKEKYVANQVNGVLANTFISDLARYTSSFACTAYGADGRKNMLMVVSSRWPKGRYPIPSPSLVFLPIDK
jgi:hypothetical protein